MHLIPEAAPRADAGPIRFVSAVSEDILEEIMILTHRSYTDKEIILSTSMLLVFFSE